MNDRIPRSKDDHVLVDVKAKPFGGLRPALTPTPGAVPSNERDAGQVRDPQIAGLYGFRGLSTPRPLAVFLRHRDQWCRTPWCGASSDTPTTPTASPTADPPTQTTGKGSASPATTPKRPPAGITSPAPDPTATPSTSPPPPATATSPAPLLGPRPDQPAYHQTRPGHWERIA